MGLQLRGNKLIIEPCIPRSWLGYSLMYQHQETRYEITVENPNGATRGIAMLELDGEAQLEVNGIILKNDGQLHHLRIVMG